MRTCSLVAIMVLVLHGTLNHMRPVTCNATLYTNGSLGEPHYTG
jgi:hypothetical protein